MKPRKPGYCQRGVASKGHVCWCAQRGSQSGHSPLPDVKKQEVAVPRALRCRRTITHLRPLRPMPSSHATHFFLRQVLHPFSPSTHDGFTGVGLAVAARRRGWLRRCLIAPRGQLRTPPGQQHAPFMARSVRQPLRPAPLVNSAPRPRTPRLELPKAAVNGAPRSPNSPHPARATARASVSARYRRAIIVG